MKRLFSISLILLTLAGCEQSDGAKYGVLQKVSHKTFPCNYYEIQVAFAGGEAHSSSDGKSGYSNAQDFKVDEACADSLNRHIGDGIVIEYKDDGFAVCGESKKITSIRIKQ